MHVAKLLQIKHLILRRTIFQAILPIFSINYSIYFIAKLSSPLTRDWLKVINAVKVLNSQLKIDTKAQEKKAYEKIYS